MRKGRGGRKYVMFTRVHNLMQIHTHTHILENVMVNYYRHTQDKNNKEKLEQDLKMKEKHKQRKMEENHRNRTQEQLRNTQQINCKYLNMDVALVLNATFDQINP